MLIWVSIFFVGNLYAIAHLGNFEVSPISSYKLEQARYGEIRNGKAVLVYVTEDFLPNFPSF